MIQTEEIWDEIERQGLSEYVSKHEIWLKSRELKDFLSKHKVLKKRGTLGVYLIIFLYFLAFLAGFGYVYQGLAETRGDRIVVGIIITIIGALALYGWITYRFTVMKYFLDSGVLTGINNKKIWKKFGYSLSYLSYRYIDEAKLENFTSEVKRIVITTKDGKIWGSSPKYRYGNFLVNVKKADEYLSIILKGIEAVRHDSGK